MEALLENEADKKFTWVVKTLNGLNCCEFMIGGYKWQLMAILKDVKTTKHMSLFLGIDRCLQLPRGWRIHAKYRLTVVNQLSDQLSHLQEKQQWFDQVGSLNKCPEIIPLTKLPNEDSGFLVNNGVKIVVEIDVLEVIGKSDYCYNCIARSNSVESQEETQPQKKIKLNDDGDVSTHLHTETSSVDVNGFQVLPTHVDLARRVFEKHPEIALECHTKNQDMRTSYMNVLLSLIKMLFKSPQDPSTISDAEAALGYMKNVGFKLDWLEKKLDQVKENKKKCAQVCEMELQLHDLEQRCKDLKSQLNKDKAEILEATSPDPSFSDVV